MNREGPKDNPISMAEDVLYNLNPNNGKGEKLDAAILPLEITEISVNNTYEKSLHQPGLDGHNNPVTHKCDITLLHDKLPCNYSHCIFRIYLNGVQVTEENYKKTLGKRSDFMTELRTKCKVEFEEMIRREEIRMNWGNEPEEEQKENVSE